MPALLKDTYGHPLEIYARAIMVSLAGNAAVVLCLGQPWTGATGDYDHVRGYLRALVAHGHFGIFPLDLTLEGMFKNKKLAEGIQRYMKQITENTHRFLQTHRAEVVALAATLIEKEDLTGAEAVEIIEANLPEGVDNEV